jgi:hypothetical protein
MGLGEPSRWVWLRDGSDRLFHAVSVWEPRSSTSPAATTVHDVCDKAK